MFCSHSFLFDVLSQFLFAAINLLLVELIWSSPYSSGENRVNFFVSKIWTYLIFNKENVHILPQGVVWQQSIIFVLLFENEQHLAYILDISFDKEQRPKKHAVLCCSIHVIGTKVWYYNIKSANFFDSGNQVQLRSALLL